MKAPGKAVLYGIGVWAVPFIAAMFIFPLREHERPLFESIMPVVVVFAVVIFATAYLSIVDTDFIKEGLVIGALWFLISIVIDLSMFMWGPMKMSFADYMKDIGVTYLMIPLITFGMGMAREIRNQKSEGRKESQKSEV